MTMRRMESVLADGTKVSIHELGAGDLGRLDALLGLLDAAEVPAPFRDLTTSSIEPPPTAATATSGSRPSISSSCSRASVPITLWKSRTSSG